MLKNTVILAELKTVLSRVGGELLHNPQDEDEGSYGMRFVFPDSASGREVARAYMLASLVGNSGIRVFDAGLTIGRPGFTTSYLAAYFEEQEDDDYSVGPEWAKDTEISV